MEWLFRFSLDILGLFVLIFGWDRLQHRILEMEKHGNCGWEGWHADSCNLDLVICSIQHTIWLIFLGRCDRNKTRVYDFFSLGSFSQNFSQFFSS